MTRVCAAAPAELSWLEERAGCVLTRDARAIKAVSGAGRILGMVAYDGWMPNSVQAHMAVEVPAAWRALLGPAFRYPFLQARKGVLVGVIPASRARSVAMAGRLGFREAHRVRDGADVGEDLVVFEMRKDECPWLGEEMNHGR